MKNLAELKTAELVAELNAISGKPPVAKWKRKVTDLVALLIKTKPDLFFYGPTAPSDRMDGFEAPADELAAQKGRPVDHVETSVKTPELKLPKAKAKKAKIAKAAKAGDIERGAIRQMCEELLLKAKGTDEATKRPLGLPYSEILDKVQAKYPTAGTSVNCLRWYATKLNKQTGKDKVVMPVRPKAAKEVA